MLSIIMPTYRRPAIYARSIAALADAVAQLRADANLEVEITVVNDDAAPLPAEATPVGVRVMQHPGKGPSAARNAGVAASRGETLLFVDDDILLTASDLRHLLGLLAAQPDAVFNANWAYPPDLLARLAATPFGRYLIAAGRTTMRGWVGATAEWDAPQLRPVSGVGSYCLLMRRATFERIGGYSPHMPISGDDAYLSQQLRAHGVPMFATTHICLGHNEADRAELQDYLHRQFRGGQGLGRAAAAGLSTGGQPTSGLKGALVAAATPFAPLLGGLAQVWPNLPALDALYQRLVNLLYLIAFTRGYRMGYGVGKTEAAAP